MKEQRQIVQLLFDKQTDLINDESNLAVKYSKSKPNYPYMIWFPMFYIYQLPYDKRSHENASQELISTLHT